MESRPQAAAHVQNTRRTFGVDSRYQPVNDRSGAATAASVTVPPASRPDRHARSSHCRSDATIHADVGAVDEARTGAGEEGDEVRQFFRAPDAAERIRPHLGGEAAFPLGEVAVPAARLGDI